MTMGVLPVSVRTSSKMPPLRFQSYLLTQHFCVKLVVRRDGLAWVSDQERVGDSFHERRVSVDVVGNVIGHVFGKYTLMPGGFENHVSYTDVRRWMIRMDIKVRQGFFFPSPT